MSDDSPVIIDTGAATSEWDPAPTCQNDFGAGGPLICSIRVSNAGPDAAMSVNLLDRVSWMPDVNVLAPKSLQDRITERLRDGLRAQHEGY